MYIFHQNSTNYIVTSIGFQFGYIFVTVMLQRTKDENCVFVIHESEKTEQTPFSYLRAFYMKEP
ncbi:hypothetical protein CON65_22005 [Bacillus pseudomycoides]|uniref:Uncharacterized protein n=1 Tax=Bacillus pseudomycoides TaxID=64104 RepID=A0AA91ZRE1_9BACI|nr:hypothetical protein COO03_10655 [Bacillus sp. AFS098217]PED80546.1 hypothetical protein CON65_22005 [Bacillus pseudomycoides]PEU08791.1 hypothetical protein CN525_25415 [Bacillus sp. AFS014408]PEU10446.1 hypothetical protein CN524_16540 [Bacillus sp. AFS019443]PFW65409.1 hypothetical protein COL20_00810 [Bacillus sp. AFS075034]